MKNPGEERAQSLINYKENCNDITVQYTNRVAHVNVIEKIRNTLISL
jgi:hypothetical protein